MVKEITEVLNIFQKAHYEAYLIGGSSRDLILNRSFTDIDIATNAPINYLKDTFDVIDDKGASLGSLKIKYKNLTMEITRFRDEEYDEKGIYPHVKFVPTAQEDAKRRDFTINALYLNTIDNSILDFYNGLKDLFSFKIRFIGNPNERIKEDPTRIIRCLRLASKLNFVIEAETNKALEENKQELNRIPDKILNKEIDLFVKETNLNKVKTIFSKYGIIIDGDETNGYQIRF